MSKQLWTLRNSLKFIRKLESILALWDWHCALAGGVLKNGKSKHDLDIVVYPHNSMFQSVEDLHNGLREAGLINIKSREEMNEIWERKGSTDKKHVEVWLKKDKRIDVIIWPKT